MMKCKKEQEHDQHICQLKLNQQFDKIKELGEDAGHFCTNCEAQSKDPQFLCAPRPFKGKPGILKWK